MSEIGRIAGRSFWTSFLVCLIFICVFSEGVSGQSAVTLLNNGPAYNRVDIAILGDGYTAGEMTRYAYDVEAVIDGIFAQQPLFEYRNYFNVHRIDVSSRNSGVDHPEANLYRDTAFDAAYNCSGIQRLICANNSKVISAAASALAPAERDVILLIVNDPEYGGSGGSIAVVSTHPSVIELVLHEEGHSFGLLADEYGGPPPPNCNLSFEPPEANVTMETLRAGIKWNHWIDPQTPIPTYLASPGIPGLYQGADYCDAGKYRPTYSSKMRSLGVPFYSVNTEQLVKRIYNWVSPIDASTPAASDLTAVRGRMQRFSIEVPRPQTHNLEINWFVDSGFAGSGLEFSLDTGSLPVGTHRIEVTVEDKTGMVRKDPTTVLRDSKEWALRVTAPLGSALELTAGGAAAAGTAGKNGDVRTGFAALDVNRGSAPYGVAVFSLKQNGVTVTEAGVPASPPARSTQLFVEYRRNISPLPGRTDTGSVDVNTGLALANRGSAPANITYTLRGLNGNALSTGHGTLGLNSHFACFIDQLHQAAAPDFRLPPDFTLGSLEIASDQALSVLALRGTNNQKNQFMITTTPVTDPDGVKEDGYLYFPHLADGGGYSTSLFLLNTSGAAEHGILQFFDNEGSPLLVTWAGGPADSTFAYDIEPGGSFHFQTDGLPAGVRTGWVRLIPDNTTSTPVGSGVFSYNPNGVLVSESGIPSATPTTHARIFVDLSENHNTGLALANPADDAARIILNAFQMDGTTQAGNGQGIISLTSHGHHAAFADQIISGLPQGFTGVLDLQSATPFTALTLRSLVNENNDFLMTTFPVADAQKPAPSPPVFPHIADGGGYATQIILISPVEAAGTTLHFYDEEGFAVDFRN